MTDDLIAWLRAQLDADEAEIAQHPDDADTAGWVSAGLIATAEQNYPCDPILQIHKRRAMAEVDAKRRILDEHAATDGRCRRCCDEEEMDVLWDGEEERIEWKREAASWPCSTVRLLALPHADRPGYREEWKP